MPLMSGERQVAPTIDGIRRDHVARYEWAAKQLPPGSRVLDLCCGVGYGAAILADAGHSVVAIDNDFSAVHYARKHYAHSRVRHLCADAFNALADYESFDAVICFEAIEHFADPLPLLRMARQHAPLLFASVPNEDVFPYKNYAFHHRHYTEAQFVRLLRDAGFEPTEILGQEGPESDVSPTTEGRTIVVTAKRAAKESAKAAAVATAQRDPSRPNHIAIVAFGPTSAYYLDAAKKEGNRKRFADFVIAINAMGSVIQSDLVFHMDDVRIQERRAAADPEGMVAGLLEWLKGYPGRVMTSRSHPDYPHLEEFPLEDVLNKFGGGYFNGTGAAALAYAIYLEPKEISLWGYDYTYHSSHKNEKGRACVEYWLGRAQERGIEIRLPPKTSLMDSYEDSASDEARIYGYDTVRLQIAFDPACGKFKVTKTPLCESEWPTAEEVESAYDHGKPPHLQGLTGRARSGE